MKLTSKMKSVAMQAKSVDELIELAKGYGHSVSREEAEKIYAELNKEGELADDELEDVAGGGCSGPDSTAEIYVHLCPSCGKGMSEIRDSFLHGGYDFSICDVLVCDSCNIEYWYIHKQDRLIIKPHDIA